MRFLPAHPERNVEGEGESPLAFNMHPENARRVWVTINERTLADSFWPAPKRIGLAEGASRRRLRFEPNIMHAVEGCAFVQENGRERVDVKRDLLAGISAAIPADTLIATSSSGSDRPPVVSPEM
jgi:3-hydroxyacyl-CoA dehydrogenase